MDFLAFFNSILAYLNAPAISMTVMFVGAYYVLRAAQAREDFDFGNMLKNDGGKESMSALGAMVSLILSGWAFVNITFKMGPIDQDTYVTIFTIFLVTWSCTKVAEKVVDAFASKWSK